MKANRKNSILLSVLALMSTSFASVNWTATAYHQPPAAAETELASYEKEEVEHEHDHTPEGACLLDEAGHDQ